LAAAAAPAAAAVAVQAAGQTDHWLHGDNDSCECLHVCFPQPEKQPSLTHLPAALTLDGCPPEEELTHLPAALTLDGCPPEEELEGAVRGGGLFLEPRMRPTGLFTAAPLAFAFASASASPLSCLSLYSFSWFPAEQPAPQLGNGASRTGPGAPGIYTGTLGGFS
jgi:hypothetical protein